METYIEELIQSDKKARQNVEEAHKMKYELKKQIADEKKTISNQSWDDVKKQVMKKKFDLDDAMRQANLDNQIEFESSLNQLQAKYESNKVKWCQEIVEHCLHD